MAIRGQNDEEYNRLIELIEKGENFDKFGDDHKFAKYKTIWKNLKVVSTRGGNPIYNGNLLVPPKIR